MDIIVRTIVRVVFPIVLTFGIYIAFHGHLSPGGGFPAGVIIATAFILLLVSYPKKRVVEMVSESSTATVKSVAGLCLTLLVIFGFLFRSGIMGFQKFFDLWSGGFTILLNIIGSIMVATAFIILVYSFIGERK